MAFDWEQATYVEALRSACARQIITDESRNAAQIRCYPVCVLCHNQPGLHVDQRGAICLNCYELEALLATYRQ